MSMPLHLDLLQTDPAEALSPRARGRPGTYPATEPELALHYRGTQLAACQRLLHLNNLEVWMTVTESNRAAETETITETSRATVVYIALNLTCDVLPVVQQGCLHITLGSWQLREATLNAGRLYRTLNATLLRFTDGFTRVETSLLPYGRRGFNWSIDPAHWSHFACVCLHQDIVAALGPSEYHPEFHITWHCL